MDTPDEHDDRTHDGGVRAHRARAKAELDQIARQTRQALTDAGIDTPVFFIIPNSGDAIVTFGTPGDPSDDEWAAVGEIVAKIVRETVGLDRVRCHEVTCASTTDAIPHPGVVPVAVAWTPSRAPTHIPNA